MYHSAPTDVYNPQQQCYPSSYGGGPVRGGMATSPGVSSRYYPYPVAHPPRPGVPLQSNVFHDGPLPQPPLHMNYPANSQQYMRCKRAMCPSGVQVGCCTHNVEHLVVVYMFSIAMYIYLFGDVFMLILNRILTLLITYRRQLLSKRISRHFF